MCELGWMRHGTDVTAGQLDDVAAKLAPENAVHLVGGITARFPADGQQDPVGTTSEGVEVEPDWQVLA